MATISWAFKGEDVSLALICSVLFACAAGTAVSVSRAGKEGEEAAQKTLKLTLLASLGTIIVTTLAVVTLL